MCIKIFFDMDGVLVDFGAGAVEAVNALLMAGDTSSKAIRRLINYEGPDKEEITIASVEAGIQKKDAKLPRSKWEKRVADAVFSVVGKGGHPYWSTLPALPNMHAMIDAAMDLVGSENVYVCTAPVGGLGGGCESGKREWVSRNTDIYAENVFVTEDKAGTVAQFPGDTCILIDDRKKYCDQWTAGGGIAIRHTTGDSNSSISQMELIVNSNISE